MKNVVVVAKWFGVLGALGTFACTNPQDDSVPVREVEQAAVSSQSSALLVNQLGYPPGARKIAILATTDSSGSTDANNLVEVLQGGNVRWVGGAEKISYRAADANSEDAVYHIEFTEFSSPGSDYALRVTIDGVSATSDGFQIAEDPYETAEGALSKAAMKFLYWKRSGFDTNFSGRAVQEFNSGSHGVGHAGDDDLPAYGGWTAARFDVFGGWYDAGDFGKYMESHAAAAFFIGNTFERTLGLAGPDGVAIEDFVLDIDESDNQLPDWLDELAWGTMWVRGATPNIGAHVTSPTRLHLTASKCTSESWANWVNVDQDTALRYCMGPGTSPAYSAVRNMAMTARLLRAYDPGGGLSTNVEGKTTGEYANQLWTYSKELFGRLTGRHADYPDYNGAEAADRSGPATDLDVVGESPGFNQGSGAYADFDMDDDKVSAAAEMYVTACRMGESSAAIAKYKSVLTTHPDYKKAGPCDWGTEIDLGDPMEEEVGCATLTLLAAHESCTGTDALPMADIDEMRQNLWAYAGQIIQNVEEQSYPYFIADGGTIYWGSNGGVAAHIAILTAAYEESVKAGSSERSYLNAATRLMDYLLGVNPMRISYVLGFGSHAEQHVHDRAMDATGKWFHGTLAGGPHNIGNEEFTALAARLGGSGNGGIDDGLTPNFGPALKRYDLTDQGRQTWECREDAINWASAFAAAAWSLRVHSADMGCAIDSDCADGNLCTTDLCSSGVCVYSQTNCDDGRPCTVDACLPATGECHNDASACCATEQECSDGTACTTDLCGGDELCLHSDRGLCCLGTGLLSPVGAQASSVEDSGLEAENVIDGDSATRWSSDFLDNQWLVIDLGTINRVSRVVLEWEAAASASYDIDVSETANGPWTTIYSTSNGNGGSDDISQATGLVATAGRYVRVFGRTRTTPYGHSLYEVRVYGDPDPDCYSTSIQCGDSSCDTGESCSSCAIDCCSSGEPSCGDGACNAEEDCASCPEDCGLCAFCGDGACNGAEACTSCEVDCGACPVLCGDGTCEASENCNTCSADCGACPVLCGDGTCDASEDCASCDSDCGPCPELCGNGTCEASEDCATCASDCGPCVQPSAFVYLEAECPAEASGGYVTVETTETGYSGDGHLTNLGNTTAGSYNGTSTDRASYAFVVDAGSYVVYFRLDSDDSFGDDSFYYRIDGGSWTTENNHYGNGSGWFWVQGSGGVLSLNGAHTLEIANREDGLSIDKIAIVSVSDPAPSGVGLEAYNCSPCVPTTCALSGAECGAVADGCGNTLSCGTCGAGESCNSGACECVPTTCAQAGAQCGVLDDGCGSVLSCGGCDDGTSCTDDACVDNICIFVENSSCECQVDGDCDDQDPCTLDLCSQNSCSNIDDGRCECRVDGDCDDQDSCTDDSCDQNVCSHSDNGSCASCSDGILNQDEEGVDCGGSCPLPCEGPCSGDDSDPFLEQNGQVVLEAESFHRQLSFGSDSWTVSAAVVVLGPDNGTTWTADVIATSPRLEFDVDFGTPGAYTMYVRAAPTSGSGYASDSVWIGLDGKVNGSYVDFIDNNSSLHWSSGVVDVPTPGLHTVQLFGREDGIRVDKIVLTQGAAPVGTGPEESDHVGDCSSCVPLACWSVGAECGAVADGCGATLDCGSCGQGESCSGSNQCVSGSNSCTCPSGCESVQNKVAPTAFNGAGDGCYFFSGSLSSYLNSWNTAEVNVNGLDVTNTYLGNWAYPAQIDGGYYIYYHSTNGTGHLGVGQ